MNHRKNPRILGYDYGQPGMYFITACTHNRLCILGDVEDYSMKLSNIGLIAQDCLSSLPQWFPNMEIDQHVIMPNHFHALIYIKERGTSLREIIGAVKSATTRRARKVDQRLLASDLWQRGYFDHVVRTEKSLCALRQYILDNPTKWAVDELNPFFDG